METSMIARLRKGANIRYLYTGPRRTGAGAPRLFDGKVALQPPDLSRFTLEDDTATEQIYSIAVYSLRYRRTIRLACVVKLDAPQETVSYDYFFSNDLSLSATQVVRYYRKGYRRTHELSMTLLGNSADKLPD